MRRESCWHRHRPAAARLRRPHPRWLSSRLVGVEVRKIAGSALIWVFLTLCTALNTATIVSDASRYGTSYDYASEVTRVAGPIVNTQFAAKLAGMPNGVRRTAMLHESASLNDPFQGYDARAVADGYAKQINEGGHPFLALQMRLKARRMGERAAALERAHAGMNLYAARASAQAQQTMTKLLVMLCLESGVLGALIMLHATGYEAMHRTAMIMAATKTGRSLMTAKIAAGLICALASYLLLAVGAVAATMLSFDTSGVWSSSVSSGFNTVTTAGSPGIAEPFVTWADFTVGGYFFASLGLGLAFAFVIAVFAGAVGTLTQHVYLAAGVVAVMALVAWACTMQSLLSNNWILVQATSMQPMYVLATAGLWFTGMGLEEAVPWQECMAITVSLAYCALALVLARKAFSGKDLH